MKDDGWREVKRKKVPKYTETKSEKGTSGKSNMLKRPSTSKSYAGAARKAIAEE